MPRRSRAVTALIAAAVVVVSIIGIGIVSAVADPGLPVAADEGRVAFDDDRLPATFDGGERMSVPAASRGLRAAGAAWGETLQAATYITDENVGMIVFAAKAPEPQTAEDQEAARRELPERPRRRPAPL